MADKTLQRLKRRDLLQMLLVQCEETERLQTELCELKAQMETVMESYERLKKKLDIKDERLNQKDERIKELGSEIERLKKTGEAEPEAALVDAAHRLNEIFKEAQQAAERMEIAAKNQAKKILDEQEILRVAEKRAADIIAKAKKESAKMKKATREYIESILVEPYNVLRKATNSIEKIKNNYHDDTEL